LYQTHFKIDKYFDSTVLFCPQLMFCVNWARSVEEVEVCLGLAMTS